MRAFAAAIALTATVVASPRLIAQRPDCGPTKHPEQLPLANALVDSVRAVADLAAFAGSGRAMLFSLVFREDDSFPTIRPLENTNAIAAVVLMRALRAQPPADFWAVRVRVSEGNSPALTVERSIYCPPVLSDSVSRRRIGVQVEPNERPLFRPWAEVNLEALISEEGMVVDARVVGSSGIRDLDEQLLLEWRRRRFQPAMLDGKPLQAVYRPDGKSPRL